MDGDTRYDRPTLVEVGDFTDLTLGNDYGIYPDGGLPPFYLFNGD
ncbi:lasso RiPP family leader peptide-containing protein [Streptosporangium sp. NPDC001559]